MNGTTDAQAKRTPEPWFISGECIPDGLGHCDGGEGCGIVDSFDREIVIGGCQDEQGGAVGILKKEDAQRIVQCVNVCAGISDPQSAIDAAREALSDADALYVGMANTPDEAFRAQWWLNKSNAARKALALLEGKAK